MTVNEPRERFDVLVNAEVPRNLTETFQVSLASFGIVTLALPS